MSGTAVNRVTVLPHGLELLIEESLAEGYSMLQRLKDNWETGVNTFSLPGEAYFEARRGETLVGVTGLNRDPYDASPSVGRLRHLYVLPGERRSGVGRLLVENSLTHARAHFSVVHLRTPHGDAKASRFYEALGFQPVSGNEHATHQMML